MSNNYKDILQKLAQKYNFPDPEYKTIKSGPDHNPDYESTVTINGETFKGQFSKTKKASESVAALEALNYINSVYLHNIKGGFSTRKICILIDSDNLQTIIDEITLKELVNQDLDIYIFMSKTSNLLDKKLPKEIIKVISPITQENNTNICITTYTGSLLMKNFYDIYFIATNDKFASSLIEMIKDKNLAWNNKEAYQINKINQIYDTL